MHRQRGNIRNFKYLQLISGIACQQRFREKSVDILNVLCAAAHIPETPVLLEFWPRDDVKKCRPLSIGVDQQRDISIARAS